MKKALIITICIAMLLAIAACTQDTAEPSASGTPDKTATASPDAAESNMPKEPDNIDIGSAVLNDTEAWVDETGGEARFYLGMSAAELLKRLAEESIEIQTGRDNTAYSQQGVGAHELGIVFVDAEPFSFLLDEQNNVKAIRIYPIDAEQYPGVAGVADGMLTGEIEALLGEPAAKHIQGESVMYYYDQNSYYLEFSFDTGFDKPRDDGEVALYRYAIYSDKNDGYWTEW